MTKLFLASTLLALFGIVTVQAQPPKKRASPHETISATLGGKKITITYGRPYLRGRKAWGGDLVPYDKVWRTGADEATKLTTEADIQIGDLKVPAGSYALFTLPKQGSAQLIVNKVADQLGAFDYDESKDLGRTALKIEDTPNAVEEFTMQLAPSAGNALLLTLEWEKTRGSAVIKLAK